MPEKKVVEVPEKKGFVPSSKISEDEFRNLPRINVSLLKTKSRKSNSIFYHLIVPVHPVWLKLDFNIGADRFNRIIFSLRDVLEITDSRGNQKNEFNLSVPYRFIQGTSSSGQYYSIELIWKNHLTDTVFFKTADQINLLKDLQASGVLKIDWLDRPVSDEVNSLVEHSASTFAPGEE